MYLNRCIYHLSNIARKIGIDLNEKNDRRVIEMKKVIDKLGKIEFKIEQYPDGSWTAESTNVDGIITGGKDTRNITSSLKDATFTYFEIPSYLCIDTLLKSDNEPAVLKQHVYA